jgi:RNA polymerase-interacting CarD/CdnL/TRCF family regulator
VYAMHGMGEVTATLTRPGDSRPQSFYQITLVGKTGGDVLVPVAIAQTSGLRRVLQAVEVPQVMHQLQRPTSLSRIRDPLLDSYEWCKVRLRQGGVLGLAEVCRFLHDLGRVNGSTRSRWQQLRELVDKQLSQEIAYALGCHQQFAERLMSTALTVESPATPPPPPGA